jgi:aminopeptidase N
MRRLAGLVSFVTVLAGAPDLRGPAYVQGPSPTATGAVTPARSPRNVNYTINARLDAGNRTITASETIAWRNITTRATNELQFHLYWNAWKNTRSTFLRERALTRNADRPVEDFSTMDVTSIKVDGVDLTSSRRFIAPDDLNRDDETVMSVPLPKAAEPGGQLTIQVEWTARVPRPFARTGFVGDFYFVAQWFPKLGVLEDEGWNTHQFHLTTEFFSDYGVYDVNLTVPRGWIVGATGVERERRDNPDGTATHRYYQEDVHDFVWTTSPDYIERRERFEHATLPPVEMRLLLQPERAGQADRHFRAAAVTLARYGEWFGAYPYGHITIVDPAYQSDADGMEYPTLVTAGARWLIPSIVTYWGPEDVTIHEAGHQWFYGIVGSNEFEDAWIDEGLNTYAAARVMDEAYDSYHELRYFDAFIPWALKDLVLRRETYWNRIAGYRPAAESDDPSMPSFRFDPRTGRYITYNKTALWLNTLERWLGWETMQRVLATYVERWQFRHPKPRDFFNLVAEVSGRDVGWFFDQVYRSSNVFDYGVQALTSVKEGDQYRTNVFVRRYGEAFFPVAVRVTFENGERITEQWDGRDRWRQYTYERASRAVSAEVDPERILLLDVNYTNNSRTLEPKGRQAATKWALKWLVWLEDALLTWAFFA